MDRKIDRFAFLAHPLGLGNLYFVIGGWQHLLNWLPKSVIKNILKNVSPHVFLHIKDIKFISGEKIEGIVILCPLLPEQMVGLDRQFVINKIIKAGIKAQRWGAKIIGLGGFTSIFTNQGEDIIKQLEIAVTTGNTYTASLVIEALLKAARLLEVNLHESTIAIIGATGDIGSICAKVFANKAKRLLLVAREQNKLSEFALLLKKESVAEIGIIKYPKDATSQADIILTSTSAITTLIEPQYLKSGAIVCDVSLPPNIAREVVKLRDDVLVFEGGYAELPHFDEIKNSKLKKHAPHGAIFGCLAETIILTLEKRFENFSLGRNRISFGKMTEISEMGRKHGFNLAPFFCGNKVFSDKEIEQIKRSIKKNV